MSDPVVGLHHPAVVVPDLEAAIAFYGEFAGFRVVVRRDWDEESDVNQIIGLSGTAAQFAVLRSPFGFLELFEFEKPKLVPEKVSQACDPGIRHLCFEVTDMDAALAKLVSLGGSKMNDPVTNARGVTSVYARDPFGNLVELLATAGVVDGLRDL